MSEYRRKRINRRSNETNKTRRYSTIITEGENYDILLVSVGKSHEELALHKEVRYFTPK